MRKTLLYAALAVAAVLLAAECALIPSQARAAGIPLGPLVTVIQG